MDCCPVCGAPESLVRDSRPVPGYPTWRRRRRQCVSTECGVRWWTIELPEESLIAARTTIPQVCQVIEHTVSELAGLRKSLIREIGKENSGA